MTGTLILFYVLAALLIMSSSMVVMSTNSVRSALYLVLSFFSAAALWLLLEAEFLAVTLILVYVGAVMVLFLFVVMMIELQNTKTMSQSVIEHLPLGITVALVALAELLVVFWGSGSFDVVFATTGTENTSNIHRLGVLLYNDYLLHFELAAMLLLVAIIAAICLAFRGRRYGTKSQHPAEQIMVTKSERVKLN